MDENVVANPKKIVLVEDNEAISDIYTERLEALGYKVFPALDGVSALYLIRKELPDLVLLDLMVPNIAGDEVLKRMRANTWGKDIPVYVVSNLNEEDAPKEIHNLGIIGYSVKANLENDDLDKIVNSILYPVE